MIVAMDFWLYSLFRVGIANELFPSEKISVKEERVKRYVEKILILVKMTPV